MTDQNRVSWSGRSVSPPEFGRRLRQALHKPDERVVWFVGAGCSVSSGIPTSAELVRRWLPQLIEMRKGSSESWEELAEAEFPGCTENAAQYYGRVIEELFESEGDRQREIERLTGGKDPGFGYAALAQLMASHEFSRKMNVAITVNFDDLIADSIYLYTAKKPLVIGHESLTQFIRRGDQRPLVVKVHGDARLAPKNTAVETARLDDDLVLAVRRLSTRARVVVLGYAGSDESIAPIFREVGVEPGPGVIYWVNERPPGKSLRSAFEENSDRVSWVPHRDFDSLMFELRGCFGLGNPDFERLESLQKIYQSSLERLAVADAERPADAVERLPTVEGLLDDLRGSRLAWHARALEDSDTSAAEDFYRRAVDVDPTNPSSLNNYAVFLETVKGDMAAAERMYQRAIEAGPTPPATLRNYAVFLAYVRGDFDRAERLFEKLIEMRPSDAEYLVAYAVFTEGIRNDFGRATELFERALRADPTSVTALHNFAIMHDYLGDSDRAEELFERAILTDTTAPDPYVDYAVFLERAGRDLDRIGELADTAERLLKEKLRERPGDQYLLGNYAKLLDLVRHDVDEAEAMYRRALTEPLGGAGLRNLVNYGGFLARLGEWDRADEIYRRALGRNPNHAFALSRLTGVALMKGNAREARTLEERAHKTFGSKIRFLELELWFYILCHDASRSAEAAKKIRSMVLEGITSRMDLSAHVDAAEAAGHPDLELVRAAADAVSDKTKQARFLSLTESDR